MNSEIVQQEQKSMVFLLVFVNLNKPIHIWEKINQENTFIWWSVGKIAWYVLD